MGGAQNVADAGFSYIPVGTDDEPSRENGRRTAIDGWGLILLERNAERRAEAVVLFRLDMSHVKQFSRHSLQLRAPCRKDWLFVRKEALVSLADGAPSARGPTAPFGLNRSGARPGEGPGSPGPPG